MPFQICKRSYCKHMQLKTYQQKVLDKIREYILEMRNYPNEKKAGIAFMTCTDKTYNWVPEIGKSPFVCIKVPTGGGKTFIASNAVEVIFETYFGEREDKGLVMWLVPSDPIKNQTLNKLRDRTDMIRESLDKHFDGKVRIFDLVEAKAIKKDDLAKNICIVISTFAAFRREEKDVLKVYQDNGALMSHFDNVDTSKLEFLDRGKNGEVIYSLTNVIKFHNPLVIVDEGHNVQTELSFDMLKAINPGFVLEFTATPKGKSNVLVSVTAQELKDQKMIKMPLYLAPVTRWQDTISEGIGKLKELDDLAKKNKKEYIRPIMLIQAEQEKESEKKVHVAQVLRFLEDEAKISRDQIAIRTGKQNELPVSKVLLSRQSDIRYIITVNALREGWDCPFAYVLVSVSNLGARISVEQTIGRIMRLPYVKEYKEKELNQAYIFATTNNFATASKAVISGLQENGYENIFVDNKTVGIENKQYKRQIQDKDISLPFINVVRGEKVSKLEYVADLIGDRNVLESVDSAVDFNFVQNNQIEKIDIGHEGELVRDKAGKLGLIYHYKDFTKEDLLNWLRMKVQRGFISMEEMSEYLEQAVDVLLKKQSLNALSMGRYELKEALDRKIDSVVDEISEKAFQSLLKEGKLAGKGDGYGIPPVLELTSVSTENFTRHLYEKAGHMNNEELELARKLDGLDTIAWWFRNPEIGGFYIQGWKKDKFRPDFIAKTKKGSYSVIEYKGEHLINAPDADYKKELGVSWAELSGEQCNFYLVEKNSVDSVIDKISKL